jgi:ribosome-associated protein
MSRSRSAASPAAANAATTEPAQLVDHTTKPSKTRRKAEMHALQDLGEALVELEPRRFDELAAIAALPERLVDAIREARSVKAWGARKRSLQFVGKLMRDVDPDPIRRQLDLWAHGHGVDVARQRTLEQWRERLLTEPAALEALAREHPRSDVARIRTLIARSRDERARGSPPHAYRELFRFLKALDRPEAEEPRGADGPRGPR